MKTEIKMIFHYSGGAAEDGALDIYDAAVSLKGLSRALAVNSFLNEGAVRQHGDRAPGAKIYIEAPRKGSFQEVVRIIIENDALGNIGLSVAAAAFWDFTKWLWSEAT